MDYDARLFVCPPEQRSVHLSPEAHVALGSLLSLDNIVPILNFYFLNTRNQRLLTVFGSRTTLTDF